MDWWLKALVTAGTVAVVMGVARHAGQRFAGLVAALLTVSAPTLVWLMQEHGLAFAVNAAIGSVSACAMLAAFALVYALVSRRGGVVAALLAGLLGAAALAMPALLTSDSLASATLLALAACTVTMAAMPGLRAGAIRGRSTGVQAACTALAAGGVSVLVVTMSPVLGTFATGLLSSLPTVSGAVAVIEHAAGGYRAVEQFLRGFVAGLFGKIVFFAAFVLLAQPLGAGWSLALASVAACVATALLARTLHLASACHGSRRLAGEAAAVPAGQT